MIEELRKLEGLSFYVSTSFLILIVQERNKHYDHFGTYARIIKLCKNINNLRIKTMFLPKCVKMKVSVNYKEYANKIKSYMHICMCA